MKYNDHDLMEEAYSQIFEKTKDLQSNEIVEEGLWDQIKGTGAGIVKGAKRGYDSFVDPETTSFGDVGKEISKGFKGGRSSNVVRSHVEKLNAGIDDFINDLKKVGGVTDTSVSNYDQASQFLKGIIKKLAKTSGTGQVSVTSLKGALGQAGFLHKPERASGGRFAKKDPSDTRETADIKI
jgi:hypothetical protein